MADVAAIWMAAGGLGERPSPSTAAAMERISALFQAWRGGDAASFESLVAELHPMVFRVSWRLLGDRADAEDAAQETFWRLYKSGAAIRNPGLLPAWTYRAAVNAARSERRQQSRRSEGFIALDDFPEPAAKSEGTEELLQIRQAIEEALAQLGEKEREAVVLRDIEGLEIVDVARAMGVFSVTVRTHLSRGRAKLRTLLEEMGVRP